MSIKKIRQFNDQKFLTDLKSVRDIVVYPSASSVFLRVTKKEVLKEAEFSKINYYLSDKIFVSKRTVMVIV